MIRKRKIVLTALGMLALAVLIDLGFSTPKAPVATLANSSTVWVDDDDPTCGGNAPCFQTIQAAVEAVDDSDLDGGFVYIRSGHYRENVVIKRTVSLIGVGSVRLEALDPKKPTILVSNGLNSRPIKIINNLEIFSGEIGIEIVDARIEAIAGNRITSLTGRWSGFGPISLPQTEAGIWIERAVLYPWGIFNNEISNVVGGIAMVQGARAERIFMNIIEDTGNGIVLQDDAQVRFISSNTFARNGNHIRVGNTYKHRDNQVGVTGQVLADIVNNQMLLAELHGIIVEAEGARLTIENNLIADNSGIAGIYLSCQSPSSKGPVGVGEEDPCPEQRGSDFIIIRNRIVGGRYGIILVTGQGKILRNWISENGYPQAAIPFEGAGLLLGQKMRVEISHNWIVNNTLGAGYSILAVYNLPDCQFLEKKPLFEGELTGSNNEIRDNEFADLCPADYPWPPGFRK
jgi:nitrous oxidase accessory protein NosD